MDNLYIAKTRIRISGNILKPGDTVTGVQKKDLQFLIKNGFVKSISPVSEKKMEDELFQAEKDNASIFEEDNDFRPDKAEDVVPEFYTEEQLDKLKSKSDIINYAESIGLSGLDINLHRPELIDKVLAYIEEVQQNENL